MDNFTDGCTDRKTVECIPGDCKPELSFWRGYVGGIIVDHSEEEDNKSLTYAGHCRKLLKERNTSDVRVGKLL